MFKRIIVATDLSKASFSLVNCLGGLKAYGTKECLLVKFLSMQEGASIALSYSTEFVDDTLEEQRIILEKQGFDVKTRIIVGSAKHELNIIAKEEDYSIIVVGAEKENLMKAHLFGGLAYDVIQFAEKPVLLIRLSEKNIDGELCIKSIGCDIGNHILFPTDFSENAESAFEFLKKMVADGAKKITLAHIQDKAKIVPHLNDKLDEFNRIDTDRLENLKKIISDHGNAEVDTKISFGSPTIELLNMIQDLNIQLVVMGSQGRGFVKELLLGSVSNNIARKSDASILLIPAYRE